MVICFVLSKSGPLSHSPLTSSYTPPVVASFGAQNLTSHISVERVLAVVADLGTINLKAFCWPPSIFCGATITSHSPGFVEHPPAREEISLIRESSGFEEEGLPQVMAAATLPVEKSLK